LELTGKKMSEWQKEHAFKEDLFKTLKIGVNRDRQELYELINRRCDEMMANGFVNEVSSLMAKGYGLHLKPMQSVGYRHMGLYLSGAMTLEDALALMKRDSRRLAKRQLTWFRGDKEILWFHPERERDKILRTAKEFLDEISDAHAG
jgi:tRNA dimethylallyltransferase